VCVREREREGEKERGSDIYRERNKEYKKASMIVDQIGNKYKYMLKLTTIQEGQQSRQSVEH